MTENDQPYSKMYEKYSLEGFNGEPYSVDGYTSLQIAIEHIKPTCPKCGALQSAENLE